MKLFQKLLLAPAALGLLAPVAASASDLASAGGLNSYIQQNDLHNFRVWSDQNQVTNVQQFNITETTDEIQRLQNDFAKELEVIKGRVGSLEKKVGTLESTQFSTTTKLEGDTYWTIGANSFGGVGGNGGSNGPAFNNSNYGAVSFNYDLRLNLKTSFTGKDLLYTRLRSGNYKGSAFGGSPYSLGALDRAFPGNNNSGFSSGNNTFYLDRIYYRWPLTKSVTVGIGPVARNTEFLGTAPFYYTDHAGLDFFQLHGAPGTYNKATGGTFAAIWKQPVKKGKPFFTVSTSLVSPGAFSGDPQGSTTNSGTNEAANSGGILGSSSADSWLTQIAYVKDQWKAAVAYRFGKCGGDSNYQNRRGTEAATRALLCNTSGVTSTPYSNNFALSWAWQPKKNGTVVPSLGLGYGYSSYSQTGTMPQAGSQYGALGTWNNPAGLNPNTYPGVGNIAATQSWTVALQWKDAFAKGNSAGMAVGQPSFVTATRNGQTPQDGNYAWEWWYKFKVSDQISLTPTIFYLSNPSSAGVSSNGRTNQPSATGTNAIGQATGNNVFGAFVAAQFKF
jgi:hypothetical protein